MVDSAHHDVIVIGTERDGATETYSADIVVASGVGVGA